jgi:hypothetical protein
MENEFKNDYYNNFSIDEMKLKYGIGNTTYFSLLKKLNIKRRPSSKISRILGDSYNTIQKSLQKPIYIPKKTEPKPDILDNELIYEKQYVPRNTEIVVDKTKPKPVAKKQIKEVDSNELDEILNRADKTFKKIQNKKQSKIAENKNK